MNGCRSTAGTLLYYSLRNGKVAQKLPNYSVFNVCFFVQNVSPKFIYLFMNIIVLVTS